MLERLKGYFLLEFPLDFSFYFTVYLEYLLCKNLKYSLLLKLLFRELFLGNLVSQLMKIPQFEDPINTVQDLVQRNITIFESNSNLVASKTSFLKLDSSDWEHIANTMIPTDYGCYNGTQICTELNGTWLNMIKYHLHGNKTHAFIYGYLYPDELEVMPKKNWWRSDKLEIGSNPYLGVITSRNWILNEVNFFPKHWS